MPVDRVRDLTMTNRAAVPTLALVPPGMQTLMEELQLAVPTGLKKCATVEEIVHGKPESFYAVALIPSGSLPPEQWWNLWGYLQAMEPRPSVLVYAIRSDFEMWTSVLDAGGFDVIVAPFTKEKLRAAISAAIGDFYGRHKI